LRGITPSIHDPQCSYDSRPFFKKTLMVAIKTKHSKTLFHVLITIFMSIGRKSKLKCKKKKINARKKLIY